MELRELRSFCSAAKLRSISRAAEQLGIGQPTVTTHIKKLEAEMGTVLFDRVKRPIQLTPAGATLAELATPLVEGIDSLAAKTALAEEEGPIHLAATHDIIPHSLLRVVRVFLARYPHFHLRIRSGVREDVVKMVAGGEVDIGIIPGPERAVDLEFEPLFGYERVLITPLDHPLLATPIESLDRVRHVLNHRELVSVRRLVELVDPDHRQVRVLPHPILLLRVRGGARAEHAHDDPQPHSDDSRGEGWPRAALRSGVHLHLLLRRLLSWAYCHSRPWG